VRRPFSSAPSENPRRWALASKQKEDDDSALQRYSRADESKVSALSLNIEKLTKMALAKQIAVDVEKTETVRRAFSIGFSTAFQRLDFGAERGRI
jgi:L-fucose isomerase-like protein